MSTHSSLVDAAWLSAHLDDPTVRVVDCTVVLAPDPNGPGTVAASGRALYEQGHVPGAAFVDLLTDLSDPDTSLRFMLPSAERFSAVLGGIGVGDGSTVVLYDQRMSMWAARVWMMFKAFAFRGRAVVLDGGLRAWTDHGGTPRTDPCTYEPARLTAELQPGVFTDRHDVASGAACVINALSAAQHRGEAGAAHYGRPGRIAGSANVPWETLIDPATGRFRDLDAIRAAFAGFDTAQRIITYCGGGIAASLDAFALHLIGRDDVSVYDASLMEWSRDPSLPMEIG